MRYIAYIAILLLVATSAFSSEAINEQADMNADGRLEVANVAGSVEITGWSRKRIEVTGELGDDSKLVFEVDGKNARVEVEFDDKRGHRKHYNRESTDLVIRVPHSTRVSASTVSADLTVSKIKGAQRLQTVSGDLEAETFDQEVVAKSVSGEIEIQGDGSRLQITMASVSGDIEAEDIAGDITAKSVSGDIEIDAGDFENLRTDTVSGDIDFRGKLNKGGRIDSESVSGDVTLDIYRLYNTEYFLESFSGDIRPILGYKPAKTSKYAPGSKLNLVEGDGESRIRVETMSGDIDITGSDQPRGKPQVRQTSGLSDQPDHDAPYSTSHMSGTHSEHFQNHMEDFATDIQELELAMDKDSDDD